MSAGLSCASAASSPLVTDVTLAFGSFCTTSSSPLLFVPIIASPINGWWPSTTVATLPSTGGLGPAFVPGGNGPRFWVTTGIWARFAGVPNGSTCRIVIRWLEFSRKPSAPGVDPCR